MAFNAYQPGGKEKKKQIKRMTFLALFPLEHNAIDRLTTRNRYNPRESPAIPGLFIIGRWPYATVSRATGVGGGPIMSIH